MELQHSFYIKKNSNFELLFSLFSGFAMVKYKSLPIYVALDW